MTASKRASLNRVERVAGKIRLLQRVLPADLALAREAGASYREIGRAAGLSAEGVRKILARRGPKQAMTDADTRNAAPSYGRDTRCC